MSLVARKYAQALFMVGTENNQGEAILADFTGIVNLFKSEKDLLNLMLTPSLNSDEKKGFYSEFLTVFQVST